MLILKRCLLPFVLLLAGCASLLPMQDVEVPLSRLQREMDKRFPQTNRYLDLFDVTLSRPVLSLQPDSDRLVAAFDANVMPPLAKKPLEGRLQVSGMLRIDPKRRAIVLVDPRLDSLGNLAGGNGKLGKLGVLLAEDLLNNTVLYTFAPDAFTVMGQRFTPTRIMTRQNSLVVSFEPAK
jgi:hypothetical protein